jgi:hypothetical protein
MTKSDFWFSMISPSYRPGNVPDLDPGRVNCQTRARAARAMHDIFPEILRNSARDRRAGTTRQFPTGQVYSTLPDTNEI